MGRTIAMLVFDVPGWSILLSVVAAAALAWEAFALLQWASRGRTALLGAAMAVGSLAAGPLVVIVAGLYLASVAAETGRKGALAWLAAGAQGTVVTGLAAMVVFWPGHGAIIAVAACAAVWMIRSYRRTTAPLKPGWRAFLIALRALVVLLLSACALRPTLEHRDYEPIRRVVLIGVDTSASMQRRDVPATADAPLAARRPARIDAARDALARHREALEGLSQETDLRFFSFSEKARALPEATVDQAIGELDMLRADGAATAIGDSAAAAFEPCVAEGRDVAAIVLITDGCSNTADVIEPEKLAALMGSRGVPVHTVGVGSAEPLEAMRGLTVKTLTAADEVERFNRLPITATVETVGMDGRAAKIVCKFADQVVGEQTIPIVAQKATLTARFVHVPLVSGFRRLTVTAEAAEPNPDEEIAGERTAGKLVHVVDRQMRLLYVEGKFRYECKYISRALAAAERFALDRRILLQPLRAEQPPPLGQRLEDWLGYHVIVFGDVSASHFTPGQLEIIRKLVGEYGKGFCMIGGEESFGRGGWQQTAVADVLPIDLAGSNEQIEGQVKVVPTPAGREAELMRIGKDGADVASAWAQLPPLPGANRLSRLKQGATLLAVSGDGAPLIVAQQYGKGRSLAIAFDSTWRWVLTPKDTAEFQQRFWRQVALHLAAPTGHIWITTDRTRYDLARLRRRAEVVEVTAGVEDAAGLPLRDAPLTGGLTDPEGKARPLVLQADGNVRRAELDELNTPGLYVVKVSGRVEGKDVSAEQKFEVVSRDLEAQEVLADLDLLRRVAGASGGEYVPLPRIHELLRGLAGAVHPALHPVVTRSDLSARLRWPIVAALTVLLCAEWAVRKRRGLV